MKKNKSLRAAGLCLCAAVCLAVLGITLWGRGRVKPSEEEAVKAVCAFAHDLDYNYREPERLYGYMTADYQKQISREEFVEAFHKERSYPYLTPLFINYESIRMAEDLKSGVAVFSQAARLPGMVYEVPFVYEKGQYRVIAFEDFPDGSYLEKFDRLTYSLDSYFDMENEGSD